MYLVLCAPEDQSARWAYEGLRKSGLEPVELITTLELAYGHWWEHRVGAKTPSVNMTLADGRVVSGEETRGVLNRLLSAPKALVDYAQSGDREYAYQELTSFYLSWLQALPGRVVNRPAPQGFCGRWRHTSEWAILAQQAGLPAPPYRQTSSDDASAGYLGLAPKDADVRNVIALNRKLFGLDLPKETASACLRFAELAENELLGISLFRDKKGDWLLSTATPYPDLFAGGQDLINHLSSTMKGTRQ